MFAQPSPVFLSPYSLIFLFDHTRDNSCDNSDYMRNGDFAPTRLHAQTEAVHMLADLKTQGNAETEVGLLTMAGKRCGMMICGSGETRPFCCIAQ